jgi:hypothetical protein
MGNILTRGFAVAAISLSLAACSTTTKEMDTQPQKVGKAALCRSYVQSQDEGLRYKIHVELARRAIDPASCFQMVQQQNQAAAALVAVAVVGGAVAYCANHDCGGGGGYRPYRGNCQYDGQYDAAGNRCGRRSAWSRPGGY